jgi:hypothetical protein
MSHRVLAPHRALLHPLWLSALVLLALNDHVFKGAGVLPGVITGKLSDFAGLLVAPVLLATLTRVRSARGWWLAHLAVGVGFSAIQLFPEAAVMWSRATGMLGVPWVIVCDPTDLAALPMLLLGGVVFPRAMRAPVASNLRRSSECAAAAVGLVFCTATSYEDESPWPENFEEWFDDIFADVYLHNATEDDLVVRVRPMSRSIDFDCQVVARDPGRLLQPSVFGRGQAWSLRPGANMALRDDATARQCFAYLVDADGFAPMVVFWYDGQPSQTWVRGEGIDPSAPGWISMSRVAERGVWDSARELWWPSIEVIEPVPAHCEPPSDATRLDWSDIASGARTLVSIEPGIDGCLALEMSGLENEHVERAYVCVPQSMFPFEPGDRFEVSRDVPGSPGWLEGLHLRELADHHEAGAPLRELQISRGSTLPTVFDLDLSFRADQACAWAVEPVCGTVTRAGSIAMGSGTAFAEARGGDEPTSFTFGDDVRIDVLVAHATERAVLDPECARGADSLGVDLEIAAARHHVDP